MTTDKSILKGWFSTGLKPEQEQFWAWIDSYYHKKDLVPMAAVDGLENALTKKAEASSLQYFAVKDGSNITGTENWKNKLGISLLDAVKANKDASGLSVQHIEAWKNTLGVGEIPENMATNDGEDDDGNPVSGTSYTKEQSDTKYYPKVSSPYFNSNYVLMADGSPKAAGDLGKNVANSSLTSVTGAGLTLGAAWAMNTAGQNYAVTGLNDVSANSAFSSLLTQNAAGQVGKSNGKQPFLNMPALLSDAEKTAWKTSMNGGWTTAAMSVAMISPLVLDNGNYNTWISLRGANLNLNPASFQITICDLNGNSLVNIPGNQVTLYQNGIDLNFYYNFSTLGIGKYRIRLWNGVAYYLTNTNIAVTVVANIDNIDLAAITWQVHAVAENNTTAASSGNGGNATIKDECTSISGNTASPIVSVKSSALGNPGDNIYIDMTITFSCSTKVGDALIDLTPARLGLCYSDFDITGNVFNQIAYLAWKPYSGSIMHNYNTLSLGYTNGDNNTTYSFRLIFVKTGNILYLTSGYNNMISNITIDATKTLSMIMQIPNWRDGLGNNASISVNRAFKF